MADLILVCGCPGSGKTTWIKNNLTEKDIHVSRDEIRFSLIKEGEEYFSHENEVYQIFWNTINEKLKLGFNVFADQTNLTPKARKYLINHIEGYDKLKIVWVDVPIEVALSRNENRKGTLAYVPPKVIRNMRASFIPPSEKEGFNSITKVGE